MLNIEAGPYEMIKDICNGYDKVTICMMSDQSVSERHYNKQGNVTSQKSYPSLDIDHAMKKIEILLDRFKKNFYLQPGESAPMKSVSKKSSSKPESPELKKRSSKEAKVKNEEEKKAEPKAAGVRRKTKEVEKATKQSERIRAKPKVEYNIDVLEKELGKEEAGKGCIEVMLAHNYDPDKHNPKGWLMSEKLDGVRCYWNG